jgi:2-succinyl-5-enolpyruvyl-6-hydroxy-3-cyclohexene-1-carboxylate synthase
MPIRDLETFAAARPDPPRILANRGANGIDGTISSAFGARAAAGGGRVVLLIGDVALLHDIGGLLAAGRLELGVTIVLIDNDGGGIFHFLPIAEAEGPFEQHVATPHGIDLAAVAGDFGWTHEDVADLNALRDALAAAPADRSHLIRVRTERAANRELHAELAELAMAAIGG